MTCMHLNKCQLVRLDQSTKGKIMTYKKNKRSMIENFDLLEALHAPYLFACQIC